MPSAAAPQTSGFAGRAVLVTGAARGIGRAIGHVFADRGAAVWACDVLDRELTETVTGWRDTTAAGGGLEARRADVTDPSAVTVVVDEIVERHGAVDILVHAAGGVLGQTWQPVEQVVFEDWRRIVAVNLEGAFIVVRAVVPAMKARGWGRIITISSGAGRSYSQTGIPAYASAKAGLIGFTRQVARELGPFGITANSVAPGFVLSNPASIRQWEAMGADGQSRFFDALAIKRLGRPDDIASAVMFFASDEAGYVTGQTLSVDGGRWMLG